MKNRFFVGLMFFSLVSFGGVVLASDAPEQYLIVYNKPVGLKDTVHIRNMGAFDHDVSCKVKLSEEQLARESAGISCENAKNYYLVSLLSKKAFEETELSKLPNSFESLISHTGAKMSKSQCFPDTCLLKEDGSFKDAVTLKGLGVFSVVVHNFNTDSVSGSLGAPVGDTSSDKLDNDLTLTHEKKSSEVSEKGQPGEINLHYKHQDLSGGTSISNQQQKETDSKNGYFFIKPLAGLSIAALVGFICWAYKNNISSQDMQEAFAAFFSKLYNVAK